MPDANAHLSDGALLSPPLRAHPAGPAPARAGWGMAMLVVIGFWWLATGVLFAAQRDPFTRVAALVSATALLAVGVWLIVATREVRTPRSARLAFLGGSLLWLWSAAVFYGGWLVGGAPAAVTPPGGFALALDAMRATAHAELAGITLLALSAWLVRRSPNRTAFWAFLLYWLAHQVARLNLFLGVPNPGERFLPDHLAFLARYFGPPVITPVLIITIIVFTVATVLLVRRARSAAATPFVRHGSALLALLAGLVVFEHLVLGISAEVPLWDTFLRIRG